MYEYITENNLYEKQRYMYSEYRGTDFLRDYLESRESVLRQPDRAGDALRRDSAYEALAALRARISKEKLRGDNRETVRTLVKSFEVKKRIFSSYDEHWKPLDENTFDNYDSYLLFADILCCAYEESGLLKYLSCLLKLDDTMISISDQMNGRQFAALKEVLARETEAYWALVKESKLEGML